jgi:hypothetical protein
MGPTVEKWYAEQRKKAEEESDKRLIKLFRDAFPGLAEMLRAEDAEKAKRAAEELRA